MKSINTAMERGEYTTMYQVENNYWWYIGLHNLILDTIKVFAPKKNKIRILDAGCGTGAFLKKISSSHDNTYGFDISTEAIAYSQQRGLNLLCRASILEIPFKDNSFDIIISCDVIPNLSKEQSHIAFKEIYRVLKKGGIFIFNLSAYNFLKSSHDRAIHIQQRFMLGNLKKELKNINFSIEKSSYRNTFLFPILALIRIVKKIEFKKPKKVVSDIKLLPVWVNNILTKIIRIENLLITQGVRFPFGLSLFGVVRKGEI